MKQRVRILRAIGVVAAAAALAVAAGTAADAAGAGASARSATPSVTGGVLFGGNQNLVGDEGIVGRTLAIVRSYYQIGESFPTTADAHDMSHGSDLLISLDPPPNVSWKQIAAGTDNKEITTFLEDVAAAAHTHGFPAIYITFEHEANLKVGTIPGDSASEFAPAWDYVHSLAAAQNLNSDQGGPLSWTMILTQNAYGTGQATALYPGNQYVANIGVDGYNTRGCRTQPAGTNTIGTGTPLTPAQIFGSTISWDSTNAAGKPIFIAEYGSIPYHNAATRPAWIKSMETYVDQNTTIEAALYWDSHGHGNGCDYELESDPASLSALKAMGADPHFQGKP